MKKYIAIATLLVAGSICAQAATGTETNTSIATALTNAKYEVGKAFSVELSLYVKEHMDSNTGFIQFADSGWIANQAHSYWGINTEDSNNITEVSGAYTKAISGNNYTYTAGGISPLWSQKTTLNGSETRGSVWSSNTNLGVTIATDGVDSWVKLTYGTASTIVDTWEFEGVVLDANKIKLDNNLQVDSCVVSAIPEPSAFGLLAGLGALALVGTRRRRR